MATTRQATPAEVRIYARRKAQRPADLADLVLEDLRDDVRVTR